MVGSGSIQGQQTKDRDTVFEYFVVQPLRKRSSELFRQLLAVSGAQFIECQSNDLLLSSMPYEFSALREVARNPEHLTDLTES